MYDKEEYFLKLIKEYRKKRHMNQEEIASKMNMPRTTYQAIESGRNHLKIEDFAHIVNILDIPLYEFEDSDSYQLFLSKEDVTSWLRLLTKFQKMIEIIDNKKETEIILKDKRRL